MADDQEKAAADAPADHTVDDLDLAAMGLEDVQLTEEEQVALAASRVRPVRKAEVQPVPVKGRVTPRQQRRPHAGEDERRATPAEFVQESVAELRKVVWPTGNQLQQYFIVVLVFVLIMIAIVAVLDLGFGALLLRLLG